MRRRGLILLELATITAFTAAAMFVLVHAFVVPALGAQAPVVEAAVAAAPVGEPHFVDLSDDARGTFLGVDDDIALEHLRTARVAEARLNKGGTSISFRITFDDGTRAAYKPRQDVNPQTVPRKEVAAYRLNRLLDLRAVPPATMRTMHRDELVGKLPRGMVLTAARVLEEANFDGEGFTRGEASLWIPVVVDSRLDEDAAMQQWTQWLTLGVEIPPEKVGLMAQLSTLIVFDMLQNNSDRFSGGNLLTSPDGKTLYFMDNTFGFQVEPEGHVKCREALARVQRFSRSLVEKLRRLDVASIKRALEPEPGVLTDDEIRAVVARKNVVLAYVDDLVAQFGADKVLVFP